MSKTNAADLPADIFSLTITAWTPMITCTEMPPCGAMSPCLGHTHIHGRFSAPITITNAYSDANKSVILLTIDGREGLNVQLMGVAHGSFTVIVNDLAANTFCPNGTNPLTVDINYLIVNRV